MAPFSNSSYAIRTKKWVNLARHYYVLLLRTPPLVTFWLVHLKRIKELAGLLVHNEEQNHSHGFSAETYNFTPLFDILHNQKG